MREVISVNLGQCGVQLGNAMWELIAYEHSINEEGKIRPDCPLDMGDEMHAFFYEARGKFVPRAILVDLESTVIDEIRVGFYRQLWNRNALITGKEDAANNYARAYVNIGRGILSTVTEQLLKMAERSDNIAAFNLMHSFSGGTGSGLTALLAEHLADNYIKKFRYSTSIYPSSTCSTSTVDPYNAVLLMNSTLQTVDCNILMDNKTMYDRVVNQLCCHTPTYTTINRFAASMLSSVFLSHRFHYPGSQHADATELLTNLVPYPRIHYPLVCCSSLYSKAAAPHEAPCLRRLTNEIFTQQATTLDCNIENREFISCAMLFRGNMTVGQIHRALQEVKGYPCARMLDRFVDWCPSSFKIGLSALPPTCLPTESMAVTPSNVTMLAGTVAVVDSMNNLAQGFDKLFKMSAFMHWFVGEGMEETEFCEAREELASLINDYTSLVDKTSPESCGGEEEMPDETCNLPTQRTSANVNNYSFVPPKRPVDSPASAPPRPPMLQIRTTNNSGRALPCGDLPMIPPPLLFGNRNDNKPCYASSMAESGTSQGRPLSVAYSGDLDISSVASSCFEEEADECARAFLCMINQSRMESTKSSQRRQRPVQQKHTPPTVRYPAPNGSPGSGDRKIWRI